MPGVTDALIRKAKTAAHRQLGITVDDNAVRIILMSAYQTIYGEGYDHGAADAIADMLGTPAIKVDEPRPKDN